MLSKISPNQPIRKITAGTLYVEEMYVQAGIVNIGCKERTHKVKLISAAPVIDASSPSIVTPPEVPGGSFLHGLTIKRGGVLLSEPISDAQVSALLTAKVVNAATKKAAENFRLPSSEETKETAKKSVPTPPAPKTCLQFLPLGFSAAPFFDFSEYFNLVKNEEER